MSQAEILYWFRELGTNPEHGWAGHWAALGRAVGFDKNPSESIKAKVYYGSWIYPGEQIRFSRRLRTVLSGEVVCRKLGQYYQAVLSDNPIPLKGTTRLRYNLGTERLQWVVPVLSPGPVLPSFKQLMG